MQSQMKAGLLTLTLFTSAAWAEPPTIDISEFRQDLVVLKVGEANYLVTTIDNRMSQQTYWGTRKTLYELEGRSASSEGGPDNYTRASAYFVENTLEFTDQIYLEWKEGIWKLRCGNQELPLTPASEAEAHRLLETAEFRNYYWEREPVMLARDEYGTYYYVDRNVDRDLSAASSDKYHVYTGWMGNMVKSRLELVAEDAEGKIFSTRTGDRRLIVDEEMNRWVEDEVPRTLRTLSTGANWTFIHTRLGVYKGKDYGSPCDLL